MIVESVPPSSPRNEPSRSAGIERRQPGSFDDPFARTLTDLLSADRTDQPKPAERTRSGPAEDAGRPPIEGRQERDRSRDDGEPRPDNDDRTRPVEVDADRTVGRDTRSADTERAPTERGSKPTDTGVDRAAARIAELLGDGEMSNATGLTAALAQLTDGTDAETESVLPVDAESAVPIDAESVAPVEIAPDPATVEIEASEMDPSLTVEAAVDDLLEADGNTVEVAPVPEVDGDAVESQLPGGRMVAELARDHRGVGLPEVIADMIESTDDPIVTETGVPANASPVAAVARGDGQFATVADGNDTDGTDTALPEAPPTNTEANDTEAPITAEEAPSITTEDPPTVEMSETTDGAEAPTLPGTGRPTATMSAVGAERVATPAPTRPAAVENPQPAPELVELRNRAVTEQLRPAFAALRRGLNGLDELRLRILDDNAGPIKVDIATVDNRVRVLLSTGNEDLMRQLGQERDRLADELRRAGFDQASIDVASERGSEQRSRFENDDPPLRGRANGGGTTGAAGRELADATPRRPGRRTSGLDLDL